MKYIKYVIGYVIQLQRNYFTSMDTNKYQFCVFIFLSSLRHTVCKQRRWYNLCVIQVFFSSLHHKPQTFICRYEIPCIFHRKCQCHACRKLCNAVMRITQDGRRPITLTERRWWQKHSMAVIFVAVLFFLSLSLASFCYYHYSHRMTLPR